MASRVVVISFDALEKDLVREWAARGDLPAFASLFETSLWGEVENPPGLYAGTVWSSFNTGRSPAGHGRFFRRQAKCGDYLDQEFLPDSIDVPFFWEPLGAAGKRVAVLNVPMTTVRPFGGLQLVDWSVHEPNYDPPQSSPAELVAELGARHGRPRPDHCDGVEQTEKGYRAFTQMLEGRTQQELEIYKDLLSRENWDLFVAVFGASHCVGHQAWHLHDPMSPAYNGALAARAGDPVFDVYRVLDRALGDLLVRIGDDAILLVTASHGMGSISGHGIVFDEILRRVEGSRESHGNLYRNLKRAWYLVPAKWRGTGVVRLARQKAAPSLHGSLLVPERTKRRYYAVPSNSHAGAVRINLVGRESSGIVQPADYDRVCEQLEEEMMTLVDADTGEPAVSRVYHARREYNGSHIDDLPDVLIEWNRSRPIRRLRSPRVGTLSIPSLTGRTGDHVNRGMFWARTSGSGERLDRAVRVTDFAPTIAALLGVPCDGLESAPIKEIVSKVGRGAG